MAGCTWQALNKYVWQVVACLVNDAYFAFYAGCLSSGIIFYFLCKRFAYSSLIFQQKGTDSKKVQLKSEKWLTKIIKI